jgi:hypothetical protein
MFAYPVDTPAAFNASMRRYLERVRRDRPNNHWQVQARYAFRAAPDNPGGPLAVPTAHVVRFEHLQDDFNALMRRHGLLMRMAPGDVPVNTNAHVFGVADLEPATVALIATVYADDFALLGYARREPTPAPPPPEPASAT